MLGCRSSGVATPAATLVEQHDLLGGVVSPVVGVLSDDVVVLRLNGGLVVLLIGA